MTTDSNENLLPVEAVRSAVQSKNEMSTFLVGYSNLHAINVYHGKLILFVS